jgi:Mrp family chromosome partitioning ATPase
LRFTETGIPPKIPPRYNRRPLFSCVEFSQRSHTDVARIFCIANQKGGVGKTTTSINLAAALAKAGERTLVVDLDPQCNATTGLGLTPTDRHPLVLNTALTKAVVRCDQPHLEALPGSRSYHDIEQLARGEAAPLSVLAKHLEAGMTQYDYVLIDCPPSLGALTETALAASTGSLHADSVRVLRHGGPHADDRGHPPGDATKFGTPSIRRHPADDV